MTDEEEKEYGKWRADLNVLAVLVTKWQAATVDLKRHYFETCLLQLKTIHFRAGKFPPHVLPGRFETCHGSLTWARLRQLIEMMVTEENPATVRDFFAIELTFLYVPLLEKNPSCRLYSALLD